MKRLLVILITGLALSVRAQDLVDYAETEKMNRYSAHDTRSYSAAAAVYSLAVPAAATNTKVYLGVAELESSIETSVTVTINASIPTGTAMTTVKQNTATAAVAIAYRSSDSTGGTTLYSGTALAKTPFTIDLRGIRFTNSTATDRVITITTGSVTATVKCTFVWGER